MEIFLERLRVAAPANSAEEAFGLLANTLNAVEDEFSGIPYSPEQWKSDGRMYPPQEDSQRKCPKKPSLRKYRSKAHYDFIGINGSIRIETLEGKVLLDKSGSDGRSAYELDN